MDGARKQTERGAFSDENKLNAACRAVSRRYRVTGEDHCGLAVGLDSPRFSELVMDGARKQTERGAFSDENKLNAACRAVSRRYRVTGEDHCGLAVGLDSPRFSELVMDGARKQTERGAFSDENKLNAACRAVSRRYRVTGEDHCGLAVGLDSPRFSELVMD